MEFPGKNSAMGGPLLNDVWPEEATASKSLILDNCELQRALVVLYCETMQLLKMKFEKGLARCGLSLSRCSLHPQQIFNPGNPNPRPVIHSCSGRARVQEVRALSCLAFRCWGRWGVGGS